MYGPWIAAVRKRVLSSRTAAAPPRRRRERVKTREISKKHIITWLWTVRARGSRERTDDLWGPWVNNDGAKESRFPTSCTIRCIHYRRSTCLCMIDSISIEYSSGKSFSHPFYSLIRILIFFIRLFFIYFTLWLRCIMETYTKCMRINPTVTRTERMLQY